VAVLRLEMRIIDRKPLIGNETFCLLFDAKKVTVWDTVISDESLQLSGALVNRSTA
jgi:hypothetical protein